MYDPKKSVKSWCVAFEKSVDSQSLGLKIKVILLLVIFRFFNKRNHFKISNKKRLTDLDRPRLSSSGQGLT